MTGDCHVQFGERPAGKFRWPTCLDFILKTPDARFRWEPYMDAVVSTCKQYGVHPEVIDKSRVNSTVKKMFLKDDSIGKMIDLSFVHHPGRKLAIKFEIDTNPPAGSHTEIKFLEFPLDYSVIAQNPGSSFAGKCHALLCRKFVKGRDWYDFSWYVARKVIPNFVLLENALDQQGPWANQKIHVTMAWFVEAMQQKIKYIDWNRATNDVEQFLNLQDKQVLKLWSKEFFIEKLRKLENSITLSGE